MRPEKSKSNKRWKQLNAIVDRMLRKLPARHGLALLVCFRHADVNRQFRMSAADLANTLGVHRRTARRLLDDLVELRVIEVVEPQRGTIPRTCRITGKMVCRDNSSHTKRESSVHSGVV